MSCNSAQSGMVDRGFAVPGHSGHCSGHCLGHWQASSGAVVAEATLHIASQLCECSYHSSRGLEVSSNTNMIETNLAVQCEQNYYVRQAMGNPVSDLYQQINYVKCNSFCAYCHEEHDHILISTSKRRGPPNSLISKMVRKCAKNLRI
eukprot:2249781-Amphidinium_carterae.1